MRKLELCRTFFRFSAVSRRVAGAQRRDGEHPFTQGLVRGIGKIGGIDATGISDHQRRHFLQLAFESLLFVREVRRFHEFSITLRQSINQRFAISRTRSAGYRARRTLVPIEQADCCSTLVDSSCLLPLSSKGIMNRQRSERGPSCSPGGRTRRVLM